MTFLASNQAPYADPERHEEQACDSKENVSMHPVDFTVGGWRSPARPVVVCGQIQGPQERQKKKDRCDP